MTTTYDDVAQSFNNGEHLYVDSDGVDQLASIDLPFDPDDQEDVRETLVASEYPIYVAVLPSEVTADDAANQIGQGVDGGGTFLTIFGPDDTGEPGYSVASDQMDAQTALTIAQASLGGSGSLSDRIVNFSSRVENTVGTGTNNNGSSSDASSGDSGGSADWLPLAIIAAAGGGGFLFYRRNKRNRELAELKNVRELLDEDITKYGEQLTALDVDLQPTSAVPGKAREEYSQALDLYERAKDLTDRAEKPDDLRPVTTSLEEGRWLLSCVDARINGETVPERRLPCFFDPAHGPSAEDVQWAPHYGSTRSVPACRACAQRIGQGEDPDSRMVKVGEDRYRPYWDAGPAYSGWAGGYYGGLLPGLMVGTMLGHSMAMPYVDTGGAEGDFSGGGGDFGGFEGGGGDFGGFGGGGGDFGGF